MASDWKERLGIVFSTNPDYHFRKTGDDSPQILLPGQQDLRIRLDKKLRKGKSVTLITGFTGAEEDLQALSRKLKVSCGVGGSAKNGEILIQGDFRKKVMEILMKEGYKVKFSGG